MHKLFREGYQKQIVGDNEKKPDLIEISKISDEKKKILEYFQDYEIKQGKFILGRGDFNGKV